MHRVHRIEMEEMYGHAQSYQADLLPMAERTKMRKPEWASEESFKKSGSSRRVALVTDMFVSDHQSGSINLHKNVENMLRKARRAYEEATLLFLLQQK